MSSDNDRYDKTMRDLATAMRAQESNSHFSRGHRRTARQRRRAAESQDEQSRQAIYSAAQYTRDIERQMDADQQNTQSVQDAGAPDVGAPRNAEDRGGRGVDSTTVDGTATPPSESEDPSNTLYEGSVQQSEIRPRSAHESDAGISQGTDTHAGSEATPPESEDGLNTLERSDRDFEYGPDTGDLQGPGPHSFSIDGHNYHIRHIGPHATVGRVDNTRGITRQISMTDGSSSPTARGNYRAPEVEEGSDNGA